MRLIMSVVAGLVGGAIGAAVWAAIAYYSNYEIGIIAWLIGVVVGIAMAAVAGDDRDFVHGGIAAVIALGAIAAGKYAVVHVMVSSFSKTVASSIAYTEDDAKYHMACDLVAQYEDQNKPVVWPEGKDLETAEEPADFPKDLWADMERRWNAMSPAAREAYTRDLEAFHKSELAGINASVEKSAFLASFSLFDLLWAFLAVGSAFRIASATGGDGE